MFIHQHNHLLLLCQDPANGREALIEAALDEAEGADMLMVKPGRLHSY
jgi:delta-aminolevulinic acid dehydratase/porphobilinogen synthase